MFTKTVIRQGEKIISLEKAKKELENKNTDLQFKNYDLCRENLNLTGILDDAQEEFLYILDIIEEKLTNNSYGREYIKISNTLEYVREQKAIIEKDLEIDNKKSYLPTANQIDNQIN